MQTPSQRIVLGTVTYDNSKEQISQFHWSIELAAKHLLSAHNIEIEFIHRSFVDLSALKSESFDMIVSGQTIEHVSKADAIHIFKEAWRLLKPGGVFCLDTPNRLITKLVSPKGFIHPEHQYEYDPKELAAIGAAIGFVVEQQLAVSPMPKSAQTQCFDYDELVRSTSFSQDVETGFSFYLELRKI